MPYLGSGSSVLCPPATWQCAGTTTLAPVLAEFIAAVNADQEFEEPGGQVGCRDFPVTQLVRNLRSKVALELPLVRKPVVSALVFRLNGSVTVTNVASFTAKYPARGAHELGALQTAPGYDDVSSLGTPASSSLAALSGR